MGELEVQATLRAEVKMLNGIIQSLTEELEEARRMAQPWYDGPLCSFDHESTIQSLTKERDALRALDEMHSGCHEYQLAQSLQSTVDKLSAALREIAEELPRTREDHMEGRDERIVQLQLIARTALSSTEDRPE